MSADKALERGRRDRILAGARMAFLRFGYERSTIADIARGAGVSRTALYHYFSDKEEVLRAVVDAHHTASLEACRAVLTEARPLDEMLIALLHAKFGRMLTLLTESSHGAELIEATHVLTGPSTRAADQTFQSLFVDALTSQGRAAEADVWADTLIPAAKGLLQSGDGLVSGERYRTRLTRLVQWATK